MSERKMGEMNELRLGGTGEGSWAFLTMEVIGKNNAA